MDCYFWIRTNIKNCSDLHFCQTSHAEGQFTTDCCISWFTTYRSNSEVLEQGFHWLIGRFWLILALWAEPFSVHSEPYRRIQLYNATYRSLTTLAVVQLIICWKTTVLSFCQGESSTGCMWNYKMSVGRLCSCLHKTELKRTELLFSSCGWCFLSFRSRKSRAPINCKIRKKKKRVCRKWNRLIGLEWIYTQKLGSIRAYRRTVLCPQWSRMLLSSINWSKGKCHQ